MSLSVNRTLESGGQGLPCEERSLEWNSSLCFVEVFLQQVSDFSLCININFSFRLKYRKFTIFIPCENGAPHSDLANATFFVGMTPELSSMRSG